MHGGCRTHADCVKVRKPDGFRARRMSRRREPAPGGTHHPVATESHPRAQAGAVGAVSFGCGRSGRCGRRSRPGRRAAPQVCGGIQAGDGLPGTAGTPGRAGSADGTGAHRARRARACPRSASRRDAGPGPGAPALRPPRPDRRALRWPDASTPSGAVLYAVIAGLIALARRERPVPRPRRNHLALTLGSRPGLHPRRRAAGSGSCRAQAAPRGPFHAALKINSAGKVPVRPR